MTKRRLALVTQPRDLQRVQSLADALSSECEAQALDWQVSVVTGTGGTAQRLGVVVSDSVRQRSQVRKWHRRNGRFPVCALVLDERPLEISTITAFDVSQWPGRRADNALDALVRWLATPDVQLDESPTSSSRDRAPWLLGGFVALGIGLLAATSQQDQGVTSNQPQSPNDATVDSAGDYSRLGPDGTVDYEEGLLSRGIYLGLVSREWAQADVLVERALWQDAGDAAVAAGAARYFLVRGEFARAEALLVAAEGELGVSDRKLLTRLRGEFDAPLTDPLARWCEQARADPQAGYESARRLVAAGQLGRRQLLDNLCVLELVYAASNPRLRVLLGLTGKSASLN